MKGGSFRLMRQKIAHYFRSGSEPGQGYDNFALGFIRCGTSVPEFGILSLISASVFFAFSSISHGIPERSRIPQVIESV